MSFILVSKRGDLQVNAWTWRPTLELLMAEGVVTREQCERLSANGSGAGVDADTADLIADVIERAGREDASAFKNAGGSV